MDSKGFAERKKRSEYTGKESQIGLLTAEVQSPHDAYGFPDARIRKREFTRTGNRKAPKRRGTWGVGRGKKTNGERKRRRITPLWIVQRGKGAKVVNWGKDIGT